MTTTTSPPSSSPSESVAQPRPAIATAGAAATWTNHKYRSGERVPLRSQIIAYAILLLGSIAFLVPFYFIVNGSLKTQAQVEAGDFIVPAFVPPDLQGKPVARDHLSPEADALLAELLKKYSATLVTISEPGTADSLEAARKLAHIVRFRTDDNVLREARIDPTGKVEYDDRVGTQWGNYPKALGPSKMNFRPALANTVVITTLCVFGQVLSCSLVGFGFARFRFRGRGVLFMIMLSTMMLPAQVTMIPVFILFRMLHLIDSIWPLVIPAWLASPFFVFMFRQFFAQVPEELIEAARIDGASNWRVYWQLMLPLSGPVIAIVAIYTFLGAWNDFLGPLIYLNSAEQRTLALALNSFKGQYGTSDANLLMAASVVCMLPCVILFFAAQKYFVESVAMTGLKS